MVYSLCYSVDKGSRTISPRPPKKSLFISDIFCDNGFIRGGKNIKGKGTNHGKRIRRESV